MEDTARSTPAKATLPIILLASVIQGWTLYGLYHAIEHDHWPAADSAWLIALYGVTLCIPLTVQLLAEYARTTAHWIIVAIMTVAFFYFGWHHGGAVVVRAEGRLDDADGVFPLGVVSVVLWLHAMPFIQARLQSGRWRVPYSLLFSLAWRNALMLAEAALFTGLLWLLLLLWQMLFHMLGINFFQELFRKPLFIFPVTSLAFGIALHLIGSVERMTSIVLEQLLNLLKWLATLGAVILTLFTIALVFKLPGVIATGGKAIGAAWLLWLVAVMVLLLNAAFRDGSVQRPYPQWISQALRFATPLTVIVALTAVYALIVRTRHYGLTVERFWAYVVAGEAVLYTCGYALAAVAKGPWLAGIARINVIVAITFIAVASLALTPLLSPYRLAANSQYRMSLRKSEGTNEKGYFSRTSFDYLRFDSGEYGREKLSQLAKLQDVPDAKRIRESAQAALERKNRWDTGPTIGIADSVQKLVIYPATRSLNPELRSTLIASLSQPAHAYAGEMLVQGKATGLYIDLNGDGGDEFVLLTALGGLLYEHGTDGNWIYLSRFSLRRAPQEWPTLKTEIEKGNFSTTAPRWQDFVVGSEKFRVDETH